MKKIILFIFVTYISSTIVFGQDDAREKVVIGGKLGVNYSNIYDSEAEDFNADPKAGFAAGGFLSIPLGKHFGLQPEVIYSQRGFKGTGNYLGNTYDLSRTLSYLDVPILLALKPSPFVTILVGPQYSYLLNRRDEFSNSSLTFVQEQEFKNDNIRKNTFCLTGGLDFNFDHLVIGLRTGWDITNNKGDGTSSTPRYKNAWLQGTIGFRIY